MNNVPCIKCAHYEQQYKYLGGRRVDVWYGWCRKRSVYPEREWDAGRPFDVDVKRVTAGAVRSEPFIVAKDSTQPHCTFVMPVGR